MKEKTIRGLLIIGIVFGVYTGFANILNTTLLVLLTLAVIILAITWILPSAGIWLLCAILPFEILNTQKSYFSITLYQIFFPAVFIGYCLNSIYFKREFPFKKSKIDLHLIIFFLVLMMSFFQSFWIPEKIPVFGGVFYNLPFARTLTRMGVLIMSVLTFYLFFWFIDSEKRLKQILKWWYTNAFFICLVGITALVSYKYLPFMKIFIVEQSTPNILRLKSVFNEPITFGLYLVMITPIILLILWHSSKENLPRIKLVIISIGLCSAIFLTYSRAAWLGMIAIALSYLLFGTMLMPKSNALQKGWYLQKKIGIPIIWIALIFLVVSTGLIPIILNRIADGLYYKEASPFWATKSRLLLFYSAIDLFLVHPLLGVGYENFAFYFFQPLPELGVLDFVNITEPNNLIIKLLTELGLIGFILIFMIFISFIHLLVKTIKRTKNWYYKIILFGGLLAVIGLFFQYQFISKIAIPYIWAFFGIIIATISLAEKEMLRYAQEKKQIEINNNV